MFTSAEVRWFFEGAVPDELERWFTRGSLVSRAAPREDHYLTFPAPLGLGLKLREGRLEIKSLVKTLGPHTFTEDVAGTVQVWEKQAHGESAVAEFERLRASAPHLWITTGKERTLRRFSLEGRTLTEVSADGAFPPNGCNVELTKIRVNGLDYWSFACEAYGDPARVEDALHRVAEHVLTDTHRPHRFKTRASSADAFSAARSHSYPEWLETLAKQT